MDSNDNRRITILIAGAIIGALTGVGAAYMLMKQAERDDNQVSLSTGEGLRLGFIILGLLRSIGQLMDED